MLHDLPGYEEYFQINRSGEVWSKTRYVNSPICGGRRLVTGRRMKPQMVKGYPSIQAKIGEKRVTIYIHRAIATLFVPNPGGKPHVNHLNGDRSDFRPGNLEWCTHLENMRHAFRTGLATAPTIGPGGMSPAAKLSEDLVREIKGKLRDGARNCELAREYGVTKGTIGHIKTGATWSHVS